MGNYNFFNLLTIALCVPLLDDACLPRAAAAWLLPGAAPEPRTELQGQEQLLQNLKDPNPKPGTNPLSEGRLHALRRRCGWLAGVAAGLAPVVYASARMVRRTPLT